MLAFLKKLLDFGPPADFAALLAAGATIVDVRSQGEYQGGHLKKSLNIPLDTLAGHLGRLDSSKPVITCCASGMRSASARTRLRARGFAAVPNAGSGLNQRKYGA